MERAGESSSKFASGSGGVNKLSGYQQGKEDKKGGGGGKQVKPTAPTGPSSCSGCGSSSHKSHERAEKCPAWGKTCSSCRRVNHTAKACRAIPKKPEVEKNSKKATLNANEVETVVNTAKLGTSNAITAEEGTGAFFNIGGILGVNGSALPHHICDQFGNWQRSAVRKHGMVKLAVKPCPEAYHQVNLPVPAKLPNCAAIPGLVDTGAQMCVAGPEFLQRTGIRREDLVTPALKGHTANQQGLNLIGVVFVTLCGQGRSGGSRETSQMVYIADGVSGFFLSLEACEALGVLPPGFPQVAEFNDIEQDDTVGQTHQSVNHADESGGHQGTHRGKSLELNNRISCEGPCRELPPDPPTSCP